MPHSQAGTKPTECKGPKILERFQITDKGRAASGDGQRWPQWWMIKQTHKEVMSLGAPELDKDQASCEERR
jgi:hypothetical protein